jgi:hypothetical protein
MYQSWRIELEASLTRWDWNDGAAIAAATRNCFHLHKAV